MDHLCTHKQTHTHYEYFKELNFCCRYLADILHIWQVIKYELTHPGQNGVATHCLLYPLAIPGFVTRKDPS